MVTVTITADRYMIVVDHEGHRYTYTMKSTEYGAQGVEPYGIMVALQEEV